MGIITTAHSGGMNIKIKGLDDVRRSLAGIERNLPYAMALSLTRTAQEVKKEEAREMERVLDRPTPFTLRGLYYWRATKAKQESGVYLKDETVSTKSPAAKYLAPQIEGGKRDLKRFEVALQRKGILPPGMYCVPGAGVKLNRYGNIPPSLIIQIMSWFQAFGEQGYLANITEKRKRKIQAGHYSAKLKGAGYFAITKRSGRLRPGIYFRSSPAWGAPIKPIIMFVRKPDYRPIYHFYQVGQEHANRIWRGIFDEALEQAIRTAR